MKTLRNLLLPGLLSLGGMYAQTDAPFQKEASVIIKAGTAINVVNRQLYKQLNEGLTDERYKPINASSYFVNPYASVGVEYHVLKRVAIQFNIGFYQTLQQYKYTYNYIASANIANQGIGIETTADHLNNNVFMEILPAYIYRHTRILAGANVTRTSPTLIAHIPIMGSSGQGVVTVKDRLEESYHLYSLVGIQQGIPIQRNELIVSLSYFGMLQKYDSGLQLAFGFLF